MRHNNQVYIIIKVIMLELDPIAGIEKAIAVMMGKRKMCVCVCNVAVFTSWVPRNN